MEAKFERMVNMFVDYVNEKLVLECGKMGEVVRHVEVDFGQHMV